MKLISLYQHAKCAPFGQKNTNLMCRHAMSDFQPHSQRFRACARQKSTVNVACDCFASFDTMARISSYKKMYASYLPSHPLVALFCLVIRRLNNTKAFFFLKFVLLMPCFAIYNTERYNVFKPSWINSAEKQYSTVVVFHRWCHALKWLFPRACSTQTFLQENVPLLQS